MSCPSIISFLVSIAVLGISGLISNGFIVIVMITQWTKCRRITSSEQLLLSLGISNLWVTIALTLFHFSFSLTADFSSFNVQIWYPLFFFCVTFRYCLTALLCFFYCIKIVNSTHTFFLWCKLRISWLIPRLLLGSFIISLFAFIVILSTRHTLLQERPAANATMVTQKKSLRDIFGRFDVLFSILKICPFLVVLLCSVLVVASLCRHVCQMTSKESHLRSFQTKAHIQAARTVLLLLLLFLSFFVAHTISMTVRLEFHEELFISAVQMIYSPAHAVILVLNNPKLRQALAVMVQRKQS